jgi:heme A synthase
VTQIHAIGHLVVVVVAIAYAALGLLIAVSEKAPRQAHAASLILLAAVVVTAGTGIIGVMTGGRPSELLHWVYGAAMLLGLLAGIGFGVTIAPRPRGLVMLATGTFLLLLAFRLGETG